MSFDNGLRPLVIQNQSLSDVLQSASRGELGAVRASMEHEGCALSGFPILRPEVSDDAGGRDLSSVIQREFNGYGAEEVVKEHSVADITPGSLEEKMNMLRSPAVDGSR